MQSLLHSLPPTLQQATADPHLRWRLLDPHGQVWVTLLWGHCSFLLGPGVHKVLFVPLQESISPALHTFYQVYGGINSDILQEDLFHSQVCCTQSPCRCGRPLLTHTSAGNTQTLKGRSGSVSMGSPSAHKVLFKPSECLWRAWGLILNAISPPRPSC